MYLRMYQTNDYQPFFFPASTTCQAPNPATHLRQTTPAASRRHLRIHPLTLFMMELSTTRLVQTHGLPFSTTRPPRCHIRRHINGQHNLLVPPGSPWQPEPILTRVIPPSTIQFIFLKLAPAIRRVY